MKYKPIYLGIIYIINHKSHDLYMNYSLVKSYNTQKIYNFKINPSLKTQEKYLSNLNK
jgi:hypothetical protein